MALSTSRTLVTKTGISTTQVFDMGGINISGGDFNLGSAIKLGNASGIITCTTFSGSGASLTNLPAGNLTGTVADARISALTASKLSGALPAISAANLTNIPAANITGTLPAISGASLTNLPAPSTYNAVINGEMLISQRGSDWTSVSSSAYHLDRWYWYDQNSSCAVRIRHSGLSPDGFHQSYRVNVTTADTSIASNEEVKLIHKIEGQNLGAFAKGTSSAKKFTLSFYVKCNKTGTYVVEMYDRDNGRDVSGSYTVSNTNWNRYTIDFPADTTGEFGFDNGSSLEIMFWLCAGSAVQGGTLNTAWRSSTDPSSATGQVNFMDSTSNEWALTGVQLEPTTTGTASDFKHEGVGETLSKCRRYFCKYVGHLNINFVNEHAANTAGYIHFPFYETMRASPTVTVGSNVGMGRPQVSVSQKVQSVDNVSPNCFNVIRWNGQGQLGSHGDAYYRMILTAGDSNSVIDCSAEL